MAQTSVAQFASSLKMQVGTLIEQLKRAGVEKKQADDQLTEQDKAKLLEYLRRSHGETEAKTKITLTRKETSEIRAQDSHGKSRTVQVEVRKKRVLVKRDVSELRAEATRLQQAVEAGQEPEVERVVAEVLPVEPTPVPVTNEPLAPMSTAAAG